LGHSSKCSQKITQGKISFKILAIAPPDSLSFIFVMKNTQRMMTQLKVFISRNGQTFFADLAQPIDIGLPLQEGLGGVNCFFAPPMSTEPVVAGDFVGSTALGGPVNFFNVTFNPHGNGTHTECAGHITKEHFTINQCLKKFHFFAKLVSVFPTRQENGDRVILRQQLEDVITPGGAEALVLRTLPNDERKLTTNYSGSNPPYLHPDAATFLVDCGVEHLLLDLPSVDREEDGGALLSHRAFWGYSGQAEDLPRKNCTITELIYVPSAIKDGFYLLNLQIAAIEIDASPSKPILFQLTARQ
jgi:kynurenine formamidase